MSRTLALSVLVGSFVAGSGCCKHIAGKCDCTYNPADAILPMPNNPYYPGQTFAGPVPPAAPKNADEQPAPPKDDAPAKEADVEKMSFTIPSAAPAADTLPAIPSIPVLGQ